MKKTPKQYAIALYEAAEKAKGKKLETVIFNFVKILRKENKLNWQNKIIATLEKYAREQEGIKEFEITSARPLSESLLSQIKKALSGMKTGAESKKIILKEKVSPEILGGLVIKSEDQIWDISLKKQLQLLKKKLIT